MFKQLCAWGYQVALGALGVYTLYSLVEGGWSAAFHEPAYWIPAVGMFLIFSAQADLLEEIRKGETVNIKARAIDFVHWFLLTFMGVGRWMMGGVTLLGFLANVVVLGIIGWQIGAGIGKQWYPSLGEKRVGVVLLIASAALGLLAGAIRYSDSSMFGWGWMLETSTAVVATLIVMWWISSDMKTIRQKAEGYPRSFFLKGVFSNAIEIWLLSHLIVSHAPEGWSVSWASNAGIAFNVIVGNVIYLAYYLMWEYHHAQQRRLSAH